MLSVYAECHNAECHYAECRNTECHYAECHYTECNYAECHCAVCRGANFIPLFFKSQIPVADVVFFQDLKFTGHTFRKRDT